MSAYFRRSVFGAVFACLGSSAFAVDYGRTTGAFGVSSTGSANYTIPIWAPPGPNGVQPSISLSYDSQSGNGIGGVGWNLGAVSSIERCPRTKHQDGAGAAIALTTSDRFCLGGNRLRLASGAYGAPGSVYHTEIADYSRITAYSTTGAGPQYFVVESKSGLKYEYGNSSGSRVDLGGTVLRWMLNKVYDRSGNNYVISYKNSGGFAFPDVISWTPTSFGATTYRYEAKFNYSDGRANNDSAIAQIVGFSLLNRSRLENIQIKSAGVVIRKYRFAYDTSPTTSRSRLTSAKECSDDAELNCLLPIAFTYQAGVSGVTTGAAPAPAGSGNGIIAGRYDFNGDGKHDIIYWAGSWYVAFGTSNGFSAPINTNRTGYILVDRFMPNGRAAIVDYSSGLIGPWYWNDATAAFVPSGYAMSSAQPTTSMDYNGDGMADLIYFTPQSTSLTVRVNTSTGSNSVSFSSTTIPTAPLSGNLRYATFQNPGATGYHSDVNGDGREDANVLIVTTGLGGGATYTTLLFGSDIGFDLPPQAQWVTGSPPYGATLNFNGDQCADRVLSLSVQIAACSGMFATPVTIPATPKLFLDWDGDGKMDALVDNGGTLGVYKSTGAGFSNLEATSIPSSGSFFPIDLNGDRLDDLIQISGTSAINYWMHTIPGQTQATYATNVPDLLSNVLDGFGVSNSPHYVSTAWSNYGAGAATNFPLQEAEPRIVVALATSSDGIGGTFNKTYYYEGDRIHAERGAGVGFQRFDETDGRNEIITRTYFEQTFPVAGMVSQQEIMQPGGVWTIARTVTTNSFETLDGTTGNQRYFIFPQTSTSTQYEVGGSWDHSLLRTVSTSNTFDPATGTLYDRRTTTTEPAVGANGVTAGGSWVERTYTPLTHLFDDPSNWCRGRLGQVQQINSHNLPYGAAITRTTNITWNGVSCRPTQSVEEVDDGLLEVTTVIGYDIFGNVNSTTVTGIGMDPRVTSSVYADSTFTTGQFPLSVTNAESHISTSAWNYDLGVPSSATDPNGISISWQYDAFGRRTRENHPDATYTTWDYVQCSGCYASAPMYVDKRELTASSSIFGLAQQFLDQFDRPIYEYTRRLDGNYNVTMRNFDSLGRVVKDYFPFPSPGGPVGYSTIVYDLANRATQVSRPISQTISTPQTTYAYYEGLRTRTVDAQGMETVKTANARGELVRSSGPNGYYQSFDYDAFGAPKQVTDSDGTTLQSSTYNVRGSLTARTDMDMGGWSFTPNALGETVSQTDAMNQTTTFVFDKLGRLKSRTDPAGIGGGTSTWTWGVLGDNDTDNSGAHRYVGRLKRVSMSGYEEQYIYDGLGRPQTTKVFADQTYRIDYDYNSMGALNTLEYPESTPSSGSPYRLKLKYDYQYGHLFRIQECTNAPCTATGTNYWTAGAANARNQVTQETLGNGLVTNGAYDGVTGWLKTIQTGFGGGVGVQHLEYQWDLAGNLKKRIDHNQSNLTEEFFYDNMYRLDESKLNSIQNMNLDYDALGNITYKLDVGGYTYHPTKKHQVTSTTDGNNVWGFGYDGNGNMTSGRGRTIDWTTFNYPASITDGSSGQSSTFSYTPDRRYWKQLAVFSPTATATTYFIGGILEKVETSAGIDYRHMIRAGSATAIVSRQTNGVNNVFYVSSDHLGSSSTMTSASSVPPIRSSFDAFGRRRDSDWSGAISAPDMQAIAGVTRRGYTDHTMLDNLELIHMNGRVQDPLVGKFVSADPFTTEPGNTQNYNRYSYAYNRPLVFVDPSGFGTDCVSGGSQCMQVIIVRACGSWCMRIVNAFNQGVIDTLDFRFELSAQAEVDISKSLQVQGEPQGDPQQCNAASQDGTQIVIAYTHANSSTRVPYATHALVIAYQAGKAYATRGGPGSGPGGGGSIRSTQIVGVSGAFPSAGFPDTHGDIIDYQVVGFVSLSLDEVANRMNDFAQVTTANDLQYTGSLNSNSYAFSFVQSLGLGRVTPSHWAPGAANGTPSPRLKCAAVP